MHDRFFQFTELQPDGMRGLYAYEHIHSYYEGCLTQYDRIYRKWHEVSSDTPEDISAEVFSRKRKGMQHVVRDIHYLIVSLQVIWKSLSQLRNERLYPNFVALKPLIDEWHDYFNQFRDIRNTFEHYDDQVFGRDSRRNSPGYGLSLTPDGGFRLGTHDFVQIDQDSKEKLDKFMSAFEQGIEQILSSVQE